jgi:anti-anti-sigma factor
MKMKLVNRGDSADVLLIGRLDVLAAPEAEKALLDIAGRFNSVTLDLAQLEYISSAGLRAIKSFYIAIRQKGGQYAVKNVTRQVMDVFEATGFVRLLRL